MNRVVLALSLAVACVHAGLPETCNVAASAQYDKCNTMCCTTGLFPVPTSGNGLVPNCCNDTSQQSFSCHINLNQPTNMGCCSPLSQYPASTSFSTSTTTLRTCYDTTKYGCCVIQRLVQNPTSPTVVYPIYDSVPYDLSKQKCCSQTIKTQSGAAAPVIIHDSDVTSGAWGSPSTPGVVNIDDTCATVIDYPNIGTSNEGQGLTRHKRARCGTDNDCPSSLKCCIRPQQADENQYEQLVLNAITGLGECIDPTTTSCCGGASSNPQQVGNGTLTGTTYLDHTSYVTAYQACCVADGRVINKRTERCICQKDTDCTAVSTSSTCCKASEGDQTLLGQLTCSHTCTDTSQSAPAGCYGQCTIPETWDGGVETCIACGDTPNFDTTGFAQCCEPVQSPSIQSISPVVIATTSQICCKRGTWGNPSSAAGTAPTATGRQYATNARCACAMDSDCPSSMKCCTQPSYKVSSNTYIQQGTCYDPSLEGCCDSESSSDNIYTLSTDVCCPVGGVQPGSGLDSCLCNSNSLCPYGGACCQSNLPIASYITPECSNSNQLGCNGYCIDPSFQTCCNNQYNPGTPTTCNSKYQTCCDDGQCVNKHAKERCKKSHLLPADYGSDPSHLYQHTDAKGKKWTTTEAPTVSINFYAWGFPSLLTIVGIAIFMIGISMGLRGTPGTLGYVVLALSAITSILGVLLLWAPTWKYGLFTIITNCAILCSIREGPWQRRSVIVLASILMLYLVDPISGNAIFTFNSSLNSGGDSYSGLQDLTLKMSTVDVNTPSNSFSLCTSFYNYFQRDAALYDDRTFNFGRNPTHGICRHDWVFAISVFSGLLIAIEFLVVVFGSLLLVSGHK